MKLEWGHRYAHPSKDVLSHTKHQSKCTWERDKTVSAVVPFAVDVNASSQ
jgi:hypothetical protein